ncbi:hypothetical protein A2U01_0040842, partial [Trifolium medium]|nr:hypothetical protein [Trifolium medium]
MVRQRRTGARTEEEYAEILHELALPGKDWRYNSSGEHGRLQDTDMEPMPRHGRIEGISVGRLIARSIKSMVTASEVYIGHPFVITFLCERLGVPTRSRDEILRPMDPIGRRFFQVAQKAADIAYGEAAAAAAPPPP